MSLLSLFERLTDPVVTKMKQPSVVASSIKNSVLNILNTRQDTVPIRYDMGIPDLRNVTVLTVMQLGNVAKMIAQQLEKFEPRLQEVKVACQPLLGNGLGNGRGLFSITIKGKVDDPDMAPLTMVLLCMNDGKIISA